MYNTEQLNAHLVARMLTAAAAFNETVVGLPIPAQPTLLRGARLEWANAAMQEELTEFNEAAASNSLPDAADALIDLVYFALGRLVEMGVNPAKVFDDVHAANMLKKRGDLPAKRPGSLGYDAVKPPGWLPPTHAWLNEHQLTAPVPALDFHKAYRAVLRAVLDGPANHNARTGTATRVALTPLSFSIDLACRHLPTIGLRKTFPKTAAAELAWYLQGTQDATFINAHTKIWAQFVEPLPDGTLGVKAAYGHRWRAHFGRDQLALAVETLRRDSGDRRCLVSAWDPALDGLGASGQVNTPCPAVFTLSIVDGALCSSLLLRSSDVVVGLPYDVMAHALLMAAIAAELGVKLGTAHFILAHAHIYDPHLPIAEKMLTVSPVVPAVLLPSTTLTAITTAPTTYLEAVESATKALTWPAFSPSVTAVL